MGDTFGHFDVFQLPGYLFVELNLEQTKISSM